MIFFAITTVCILAAWIHSDLGRRAEIDKLYQQHRQAEECYDQASANYQRVVGELTDLRKQIGKPEGVVFLPEKSYYEDHCTLTTLVRGQRERLRAYARVFCQIHKLTSSENFPPIEDTSEIDVPLNPTCQFGCKPNKVT